MNRLATAMQDVATRNAGGAGGKPGLAIPTSKRTSKPKPAEIVKAAKASGFDRPIAAVAEPVVADNANIPVADAKPQRSKAQPKPKPKAKAPELVASERIRNRHRKSLGEVELRVLPSVDGIPLDTISGQGAKSRLTLRLDETTTDAIEHIEATFRVTRGVALRMLVEAFHKGGDYALFD